MEKKLRFRGIKHAAQVAKGIAGTGLWCQITWFYKKGIVLATEHVSDGDRTVYDDPNHFSLYTQMAMPMRQIKAHFEILSELKGMDERYFDECVNEYE